MSRRKRTGSTSLIGGAEDDSGVKESAGDARSDGDEVALSEEDFDLRGTRHFREVDGAAAADESGVFFGCRDTGKIRNEFAGMDAKRLDSSLPDRGLQSLERVRVRDGEFGHGGAAQAGEMSAASELAAHVVSDGPYVGA